VAEVLWDKRRDDDGEEHRFVVLAVGMNDLLRPALYGARHRIVPLAARGGPLTNADVVGPVCETSDRFASERTASRRSNEATSVAILDAGAYGAVMSSHYNGRSSLPQVIHEGGRLMLAAPAEPALAASAMAAPTPL
jgi:diaminopimelate decarboxylase